MTEADLLKQVLGPLGAVVVLAIVVYVLWKQNVALQKKRDADRDELIVIVREMIAKTVEDTAAINRLTEILKGRQSP